jgi:hypothetical protein
LSHRSEQPVVRQQTLSQLRYRSHGGLTFAALDGVRLPLKLSLPSASRSAYGGGRTFAALDRVGLQLESAFAPVVVAL